MALSTQSLRFQGWRKRKPGDPCTHTAFRLPAAIGLPSAIGLLLAVVGGAPAFGQITTPIETNVGKVAGAAGQEVVQSPLIQQFNYGFRPAYQQNGWSFSSSLFQTNFDTRFFSGYWHSNVAARKDTPFAIGPLSLQLSRWRTDLIMSDNVDATRDPRSGWVARSGLSAEIFFQLNDSFFFRLSGELVWLPFKNKIGLNGFSLYDQISDGAAVMADLGLGNNFLMGWRGRVNEWDVSVFNALQNEWLSAFWRPDARANLSYSVWDPVTFEAIDRAGRYSFGASSVRGAPEDGGDASFNEFSRGLGDRSRVLRNVTAVNLGRNLERVEARFDLSVSNTYEWRKREGASGTDETRTQGATASVYSVRDNLRFRPFAVGKVFRRDNENWMESGTVGVVAPLTDQVNAVGQVGYTRLANRTETSTYRVGLRHVAGPYTVHSASWRKEVYDDYRVRKGWDYRLSQVLGSRLSGTFIHSQGRNEFFDGSGTVSRDETWVGQLTFSVNPRLYLNAMWMYSRHKQDLLAVADFTSEQYQVRVNLVQELKNNSRFIATYMNHDVSTPNPDGGYIENALFLTFERDF